MDEVFLLIQLILLFVVGCNCGTISEYVYPQFLARSYFEPVHGLAGHFGVLMSGELNNSVTFVLTLDVLGEFNVIDFTEWLKELANLLLRQRRKGACEAANIDPVVLLATDTRPYRCKCILTEVTAVCLATHQLNGFGSYFLYLLTNACLFFSA